MFVLLLDEACSKAKKCNCTLWLPRNGKWRWSVDGTLNTKPLQITPKLKFSKPRITQITYTHCKCYALAKINSVLSSIVRTKPQPIVCDCKSLYKNIEQYLPCLPACPYFHLFYIKNQVIEQVILILGNFVPQHPYTTFSRQTGKVLCLHFNSFFATRKWSAHFEECCKLRKIF